VDAWFHSSVEDIVWLGGAAVAGYSIWRYVLVPMWRIAKALVELSDAMPILIDIAHEFKPNNGNSLRDVTNSNNAKLTELGEQVAANSIGIQNMEQQMEQLILACPAYPYPADKDRRIIVDYPYIARGDDE